MLAPEWKAAILPPPGYLYVERDEVPGLRGGIHLPPGYLSRVRMVLSTVVCMSPEAEHDLPDVRVGDRVMLAATAGQQVVFGYTRAEESELWLVQPKAILVLFTEPVNTAEDQGSHFLRSIGKVTAKMPTVDEKWVEGESRGPR